MTHPWSEAEDLTLRLGWAAGDSVSTIARKLPRRSRNAVTGRASRLGLPRRPSPIPDPAARAMAILSGYARAY